MAIAKALVLRGWYCRATHGNAYQAGFPDLYACHRRLGCRWIEVKRPEQVRFTQAQLDVFTKFSSKDVGVWVITSGSDGDISRLMGPSNWSVYLMQSRGITLNDKVKIIPKKGPEAKIQNGIIQRLTKPCGCGDKCPDHPYNNWFCLETYGSQFQSGFPDIYCCHKLFGSRWVECKNPEWYKFTPAQLEVFPSFTAQGVAVHILVDNSDFELAKLFGPSNWHTYLH